MLSKNQPSALFRADAPLSLNLESFNHQKRTILLFGSKFVFNYLEKLDECRKGMDDGVLVVARRSRVIRWDGTLRTSQY